MNMRLLRCTSAFVPNPTSSSEEEGEEYRLERNSGE